MPSIAWEVTTVQFLTVAERRQGEDEYRTIHLGRQPRELGVCVTVIQASESAVVKRSVISGEVDTVIGCVEAGTAEINLVVTGTHIDLSVTSTLEDDGPTLAAIAALQEREAHAYIGLDDTHAEGLIRLLRQAIEVRRLGMAGTANGGRAEPGLATSPDLTCRL